MLTALRSDQFLALFDEPSTGFRAILAGYVVMFVLTALFLAVAADIDAKLGQFLETRQLRGRKSFDRRGRREHGGDRPDAILHGGIACSQQRHAMIETDFAPGGAERRGVNQSLVFRGAVGRVHVGRVISRVLRMIAALSRS